MALFHEVNDEKSRSLVDPHKALRLPCLAKFACRLKSPGWKKRLAKQGISGVLCYSFSGNFTRLIAHSRSNAGVGKGCAV